MSKLKFKLEYKKDGIASEANGEITADNFDDMVKEIARWMHGRAATCVITEAKP